MAAGNGSDLEKAAHLRLDACAPAAGRLRTCGWTVRTCGWARSTHNISSTLLGR